MGVEFTDGNHFPLSTVNMTCIYELFFIVFICIKRSLCQDLDCA